MSRALRLIRAGLALIEGVLRAVSDARAEWSGTPQCRRPVRYVYPPAEPINPPEQ